MASGFFRTTKSLESDRRRLSPLLVLPGIALLVPWTIWFLSAKVARFEVSDSARVEVSRRVFPVQAPESGQVVANFIEVGRAVEQGEVAVELDSTKLQHEVGETKLMLVEAEAGAAMAEEEARRLSELRSGRHMAELDYLKVKAEAKRNRAKADLLVAKIERLNADIERRRIRFPVAGRIGEVSRKLQTGAVLAEAEHLGTVVPKSDFKGVAQFPPEAALGRIRAGQPARMFLRSFPWAQYGHLNGRVTVVSGEVRDGQIVVEFTVVAEPGSLISLQHGLPGSVEVEVERITPASLVLQAAGAAAVQALKK